MSESKLKTISINPDIFAGFGGGSNTRKKKPEKPLKIKAPVHKSDKTRKKEILQRIRANQEKQYKTLFDEKDKKHETVETAFNNEFDESVKFMESVVENTEKANLNRTLKNQVPMTMGQQSLLFHPDPTLSKIAEPLDNIIDTIGSSFSPSFGHSFNEPVASPLKISPPPQYGCLKGGMMPTYRNYTMKAGYTQMPTQMPIQMPIQIPIQQNQMPIQQNQMPTQQTQMPMQQTQMPTQQTQTPFSGGSALTPAPRNIVGRIRTPEEITEMKKLREIKLEALKPKPKNVPKKVRKLMKRTFRVGRDKYKPAVGVLLPNKTIKNNVTTQAYMLKQTPIAEVRKYLLKTGFIKVGSAAPNDVLRKIYESIKLIDGDVKNHNPDNLLYNFFNDNTK
jgi:hypothetical protein